MELLIHIPILLLLALGAYYDAFRLRLVPNSIALVAMPFSLLALVLIGHSWKGLLLATVIICTATLARLFGAADGKWLLLLLPLFGAIDTAVIYFAGSIITLFGAVPFIIMRIARKEKLKGMPVPMLPGFYIASIGYVYYTTNNVAFLAVGLTISVLGIIYGMWELKNKPLPTIEWINQNSEGIQEWHIIPGKATDADKNNELHWTKDRHRIFLSSVLDNQGYEALWGKKEWAGKIEQWEVLLESDGKVILKR